jgi:N utilization substance protein A
MAVALGESGVKTLEDLAGCATDDLVGWNETVNGERKHFAGALESLGVTAEDANAIIMAARIAAGWVEAPAVPVEPAAAEADA